MKKLVPESLNEVNFERGREPKESMDIGLYGKLHKLIEDPEFQTALYIYNEEDRDQTIPMWTSALDDVPGDWQFIGDRYWLEEVYPDIWNTIMDITNTRDSNRVQEGEVEPNDIPEWFMDDYQSNPKSFTATYRIYDHRIILLGSETMIYIPE